MTKDDIIRMAREAGLVDSPDDYHSYWTADSIEILECFAKLAYERGRKTGRQQGHVKGWNAAMREFNTTRDLLSDISYKSELLKCHLDTQLKRLEEEHDL